LIKLGSSTAITSSVYVNWSPFTSQAALHFSLSLIISTDRAVIFITTLHNKCQATRTHVHTLTDHILALHFPLSPHFATLTASVCSVSPRLRHLDPTIATQPLRKLDIASAVVDHFFRVNVMMLTPHLCTGGAEWEDAVVSDHVVVFTLSEALEWRVLVASRADEVRGDVWR
jgi:hypothetical protein